MKSDEIIWNCFEVFDIFNTLGLTSKCPNWGMPTPCQHMLLLCTTQGASPHLVHLISVWWLVLACLSLGVCFVGLAYSIYYTFWLASYPGYWHCNVWETPTSIEEPEQYTKTRWLCKNSTTQDPDNCTRIKLEYNNRTIRRPLGSSGVWGQLLVFL